MVDQKLLPFVEQAYFTLPALAAFEQPEQLRDRA